MPSLFLLGALPLLVSVSGDSTNVAPRPSTVAAPVATVAAVVPARSPLLDAPAPLEVDSLVVEKKLHRLTVYRRGAPLKMYLVALGNPVGDKQRVGDYRTPEGLYTIADRNKYSRYHKSLRISYPDTKHRRIAAKLGTSPGGDIMLHGLPKGFEYFGAKHRQDDWTEGCVALTNEEIDELFRAVPVGAKIEIKP